MPRYGESSHETPAYFINTIARLKLHLCDLAYHNDNKRGRKLRPEECANCISPCCYGQKLLKLLRADGMVYPGNAQYKTGYVYEMTRSGATILSMKRVLMRRKRGKRKECMTYE